MNLKATGNFDEDRRALKVCTCGLQLRDGCFYDVRSLTISVRNQTVPGMAAYIQIKSYNLIEINMIFETNCFIFAALSAMLQANVGVKIKLVCTEVMTRNDNIHSL